jgi:hypothetical protein
VQVVVQIAKSDTRTEVQHYTKYYHSISGIDTNTYKVSKEHSFHRGLWLAKIEPW